MMLGVASLFSNIFSSLYARVMGWSRHPRAVRYLAGLSFAESSFFPIPPDVMLAPMCLACPQRAYWLAFVTTVSSVLGGLLGYFIGLWAIEMISPWLMDSQYAQAYALAQQWFADYGVWAVLLAGFSPIPYKVFTIAAGAASMAVFPCNCFGFRPRWPFLFGCCPYEMGRSPHGAMACAMGRPTWMDSDSRGCYWIVGLSTPGCRLSCGQRKTLLRPTAEFGSYFLR
jgi:membrane protein YqaA with SNARE-associated domain